MELLLTHAYFLEEDPKELQIMKPYVPLGLLYIASHLRAHGTAVEVFDATFNRKEELFRLLQSEPPAVLGIYANLMTRPNVIAILQVATEAGWTTVVGGPEPGAYVEEYLASGADVIVVGEGEITMQELLPVLRFGKNAEVEQQLAHVNGIAFRTSDGRIIQTSPRAQISNLDAQPWPLREAVDIGRYIDTWRKHHGSGSVSLITARGCPYHCRWCSHQVFGKTHRRRKPGKVVDEIEWLISRYQPDIAWMADDVFTIHHGWLYEYAAEMQRRGLRLPFECISRADRLNERTFDTLAELGCFRIWIGSESGSQPILDSMERGVTVEQVQRAVAMAQSRGIQAGMFLMWGYEGEQIEDIEATVEHVKRTHPDVFFTTVAYPIKGTPYFEQVNSRVISPKSWQEASDRDYRIRGRHSRQFYKFADQLLRAEVELNRLATTDERPFPGPERRELDRAIAAARQGLQASFDEVEA
jgi:radical SAM superfamily enzyme YgiQ (UPF0313 family)